jgi:hypothetical protein
MGDAMPKSLGRNFLGVVARAHPWRREADENRIAMRRRKKKRAR